MVSYKKLESLLSKTMSSDRFALKKELRKIKRKNKGKKAEPDLNRKLHVVEKRINDSIRKKQWRIKNRPNVDFKHDLPITAKKDEIIDAIKKNQVIIISGETGSGKTTQIPKFCLDAGRGINGIIGCTQPRRIAAVTVAARIAEELGEEPGKSVGYKIRFEEKMGENPFIKIMTDGMLLTETQSDSFLNKYDTLIIDEAHERSLNIDFILGIIKNLLSKRRDLKLIITSATIDTEKFSKAFNNAPVIEVSGKMYPVETRYEPALNDEDDKGVLSYTERAVKSVLSILAESNSGDVLVFMPTEQDIRETCESLEKKRDNNIVVYPLFARLPGPQQKRIFKSISKRKIIVSTNVAETSLTIPNIKYVVDTGLARINQYSPSTGTVSLPVKAISKSSADQRKGRCGRVREGVCIRLYEEEDYENRPQFTPPELFRVSLAEVILKMISLRLGDVCQFPFIDKPKKLSIKDGFNTLLELGATREIEEDKYTLTDKGRLMARLPIDPKLSRILIEAGEKKCLREILIIASMLTIQDPRERPVDKEKEADTKHYGFRDQSSDFISLLNIWNKYHEVWSKVKSQNKIRKYCKENFLSYNRIKELREIHSQLLTTLEENGISIKKIKTVRKEIKAFGPLYNSVHQSLLTGFLPNIALKKSNNMYLATKQREAMIFPGSGLFNNAKTWTVSAEIVQTSNLYLRTVANVEAEWLEEAGGSQCVYSHHSPYWDNDRNEVIAFEHVSLYGLSIIRDRRVPYGPINPVESTSIFIRQALVDDIFTQIALDEAEFSGNETNLFNLQMAFPFIQHNIESIKKVLKIEDRIRKRLMISRDDLYGFYSNRIDNVFDINTMSFFLKKKRNDHTLRLSEKDLLMFIPDIKELEEYPENININGNTMNLGYCFDPDSPKDGITIKIPLSMAQSINLFKLDYHVPGLYREKVSVLIKNLPKQYRKQLVPVSSTIEKVLNEMPAGETALTASLGKFLYNEFNVEIPLEIFESEKLPVYLNIRISVIDKDGKEIKVTRNPGEIYSEIDGKDDSAVYAEVKREWEREDIREWDFSDLPDLIDAEGSDGLKRVYYTGLTHEDGKIALRVFKNKEKALESHKEGIYHLLSRELAKRIDVIRKKIIIPDELNNTIISFGGSEAIQNILYEKITREYLVGDIRRKEEFSTYAESVIDFLIVAKDKAAMLVLKILQCYKEARESISRLEKHNNKIQPILIYLKKIVHELDTLVPKDFLNIYNNEEMSYIEKYTKALSIRAERGCVNISKDQQKENEVLHFKDALEFEEDVLSPYASDEKKALLRELFWLLEEYKVSVFAPEIKTRIRVSKKILEKRFEEYRGMS